MKVVRDPLLRNDELWSALEGAIVALTDAPYILYEKKHDWEGGLNSTTINRLAREHGLSKNPVFEEGQKFDGDLEVERWLEVFHPDLKDPTRVTTWSRSFRRLEPQARIDRLVDYLRDWQEKREKQLRAGAEEIEVPPNRPGSTISHKEKPTAMTTEKIKVLLFAANPEDTSSLALDEEIREIETKIRMAEHRDSIQFIPKLAVRPDDLQQNLLEHQPHIVHFAGHGTKSNQIILKDSQGNAKPVSQKALRTLFSVLKDNIRGVVLNACYSEAQAKAITEVIDFAVGMKDSISDEAAILFSGSFYRALGFNRSVGEAFKLGLNALEIEGVPEEDIPQLLLREGVDPNKIYLLGPR